VTLATNAASRSEPTKLLYPIGQKNYDSDLFIRGEWEILRKAISEAYMMQIFGYSAPANRRRGEIHNA
jgi:hypothetical protein